VRGWAKGWGLAGHESRPNIRYQMLDARIDERLAGGLLSP
jgi:hypothetical protein